MTPCSGNAYDHCCYFGGKVCTFLEENTLPDRKWVCGLMREHQDWDKVLADPMYQQVVIPLLEQYVWPHSEVKYTCKTWPTGGCCCGN
jgi:hypothetical protein